jgi:hypothetical protein
MWNEGIPGTDISYAIAEPAPIELKQTCNVFTCDRGEIIIIIINFAHQ